MESINELLLKLVELKGSDLHLKMGSPPLVRVDRELTAIRSSNVSKEEMEVYTKQILNIINKERFNKNFEADFAYTVPGVGRFRTNVFNQRGSTSIVMRHVKTKIPSFDELNMPGDSFKKFCVNERGIILVTGATNSGKSTTLATMIDYINMNFRKHIITVEDPIEYLHNDKLSIINQREVGIDTLSFESALKNILRQDPDVILVGEMRDADSFSAALQAAETGHLVMTTIHASNAAHTIDRILDFFKDPAMCDQARFQLANNLVAIICQRLVPRQPQHGGGLVPAVEILTGTPLTRKVIRENQLKQIPKIIASGQDSDMISFNQSILKLIQDEDISEEIGMSHASNPEALKMNLQGIFLDEGRRIISS